MRICYFNLTEKIHTRDVIYLNGLKKLGVDPVRSRAHAEGMSPEDRGAATSNGVEIIDCRDWTPGIKKFWNLYKKHRALKNNYDLLFIGFSGHILVPFAKLISDKKIVFDALGSLYDGIIMSRKKYGFLGWRILYVWLVDWLAFNLADISLVDTNTRKKFISDKFFIPERKLIRLWTGVDDTVFIYNPDIKKLPPFTVLFRGALMPESGIEYMLEAAKILEKEPVQFRIMGSGYLAPLVEKMIKDLDLKNVEWLTQRFSWEEMTGKMQECHLSLGQLSDHKRQEFHVPFKTMESMALHIPYMITSNSYGIMEFLKDNETCLTVKPASADDLAKKILWAKNNPDQLNQVAENAHALFKTNFTTDVLARELNKILSSLLHS